MRRLISKPLISSAWVMLLILNISYAGIVQEGMPKRNQFWWPNQLDLSVLRSNLNNSSPIQADFNYAKAYLSIDHEQLKNDIKKTIQTSKSWWPADFGSYGPFFIRMAWHAAGTYRVADGRGGADGGQQRFEPLASWPDNANLDKARRLLWPIKKKYGKALSWSDLMVLTGNVALESMGFKTIGFAAGRIDDWQPDLVYWGPETSLKASKRKNRKGQLKNPLAATEMGLIYVNPEGPNGNPDPAAAAKDIRITFARMAMNDEETVALIAGGHAFGKSHGQGDPKKCLGPAPADAPIEQQAFGWKNHCGKGNAEDTITGGPEGAWTSTPTAWSTQYLHNLFHFKWVKTKSPAGAIQWVPASKNAANLVPDAYDKTKRHPPMMFTTDLSLKIDPAYRKIAKKFMKQPEYFEMAFAKAWFKLTHRDMGPRTRYIGKTSPPEVMIWQDPLPTIDYAKISDRDIRKLKQTILRTDLKRNALIKTAWASASSFRNTDKRGGANGARIALEPQKFWSVNDPEDIAVVIKKLRGIKRSFNKSQWGKKHVSLADLIILGGNAAIEDAASKAGVAITVPFVPGRADASQEQTDIRSFSVLETKADAFRNYYSDKARLGPQKMMVEKAAFLNLSIPEMTVLLGGLRVLDINTNHSQNGVLTRNPGVLSNDFFINLLDMQTVWTQPDPMIDIYEGKDRDTGVVRWKATSVDLIFGANSELRAFAEFYAADDSKTQFINDFISAWVKVMQLDRFDLSK